ncbi:MAG: hypothetical protein RLZZ618_1674 [Pseudomonadota bacterium]|jgi:diguanylate cyclase (GGDEF)-like protein/PAS domain S-box-containing protein
MNARADPLRHRVLLIESSATLRRGMEKLLGREGFDVVCAAPGDAAVPAFERELGAPLCAVIIGWPGKAAPGLRKLFARLQQPDARKVAVLVLAHEPELTDDALWKNRAFTQVHAWQAPAEVPRHTRALLAQVARETRPRLDGPAALKVLLVDDSRTSLLKHRRLLESHGYLVTTCENASAALLRVKDERFDLAIIDYYMPGQNGAMLCRALRALPSTRELTLAILTGSYDEGLIADCLDAGAAECMFKNESDELFLARVRTMAQLRERELRLEGERLRLDMILTSVGDGVYEVDRTGRIRFANPAALRLLQCPDNETLVGQRAHERIHHADERGRPVSSETCFLQQAYELGDSLSNWETVFWRADGQALIVECTVRPLQEAGECTGVVVAFRDIAERKRFEAELQWQVHHDHLTKLSNRPYFEDMLAQELFRLKRSAERSALLFIDLDRFKHINDTGGHAAGDALLVTIAQRLKSRSRQSDIVARLGGDEFAVLLRNVDDESVIALAEKFRAILDDMQFSHDGRDYDVSGSVGIHLLDRHTGTPAQAMNRADAACQVAKREGRNQIHLFDPRRDAEALASLEASWSERLRSALSGNDFSLRFQPILDLGRLPADAFEGEDWSARLQLAAPHALHGYEVFVRLDDTATSLAPRAFLAHAERFELLPALDGWVLERLTLLLAERPPRQGVNFHLNVATMSLASPAYRSQLSDFLRSGVLGAGQLSIEVKESDAIDELMTLVPALEALTQLGLRLVLDEYGLGMSGVGHLRALPLSAVKLDGPLVQSLQHADSGGAVVRAMTDLAHAMQIDVIAPMAEDPSTLSRLRAAGVDQVQGFALGHPTEAWGDSTIKAQRPRAMGARR